MPHISDQSCSGYALSVQTHTPFARGTLKFISAAKVVLSLHVDWVYVSIGENLDRDGVNALHVGSTDKTIGCFDFESVAAQRLGLRDILGLLVILLEGEVALRSNWVALLQQ
jgi:hypothetical protein